MGRPLGPGDSGHSGAGVLVDRTFVDQLFGGANPLGRRVRYVGRSREAGEGNMVLDRWYEIVGVVSDFPPHPAGGRPQPRLYHAAAAGDVYPAVLAVRVRASAPATFSDRLRQITAGVNPALQLRDLSTAEDAVRREQGVMRLIGATLIAVIGSVVALSAAGIYALMSLTVARRRKEIGIRAALGADPTRILTGVFARAAGQLGAGAALGICGAIMLEGLLEGEVFQGHGAVILPLVAAFMTAVGLLAALGPARRGLRIHPTEALREE
jgi:putative ABC transport system permease protein